MGVFLTKEDKAEAVTAKDRINYVIFHTNYSKQTARFVYWFLPKKY